ncbi:ATP-dependent DNA helicase [Clostridium paraputrificum]|uniref:ATP-dependent DNA helicase n=1 Tax=Clostridium paraputrificum TaxID=29363 RepID=UPI003D34BFBA
MEIKKSVREFIEFIMSRGSLDNRFTTNARAIEGVRAHQKLQKSNEELYKDYEKEVFLKADISMGIFKLHLEGRCDGIIVENGDVVVEEIKSTYTPLVDIPEDYNTMHWAQGKIYAYMLCREKDISYIYVQLSYYNLDCNEVKSFRKKYEYIELVEFVKELVNSYEKYAMADYEHKKVRNETIEMIQFPFKGYRKGQLELAKAWYGTIREGKRLFVQAPTGIGKTISTIFPSIKGIGAGLGDRIFYLTAKNVNKKVAEDTFDKLREDGLIFRTVSLVAKEKICLNDKVSCNPEDCSYAKDYYSKVKNVIFEVLENEEGVSREILQHYGEKYKICPFELSLELVNWSDGVICDYNYIFDPRVYLRRVIDEKGRDNIILLDEAHNLVSRGRDMYTASLYKSKFLELRRETRGKVPSLYRHINKINDYFIQERRNCEIEDRNYISTEEMPKELCQLLRVFTREAEEVLGRKDKLSFREKLLDLYFDSNSFLSMSELYGDDYVTYVEGTKDEVEICLFCVDPSKRLKATMDKCRATVLFSATLSPFEYFIKVLGGDIEDYRLRLNSPFPKENLKVYHYPGNTRYMARERTLPSICGKIMKFIKQEEGNYIIFFPSYDYMKKASEFLYEEYCSEEFIVQKSDMDEKEKEEFLNQFSEDSKKIALCVVGGAFSEGIDLPGKRLIGTVIVGVGYPKISLQGEIIKNYYKEDGDKIAYVYPGINKVMQAVGRVIRTESDIGRVLLVDDRYRNRIYSSLIPDEWKPLLDSKK